MFQSSTKGIAFDLRVCVTIDEVNSCCVPISLKDGWALITIFLSGINSSPFCNNEIKTENTSNEAKSMSYISSQYPCSTAIVNGPGYQSNAPNV